MITLQLHHKIENRNIVCGIRHTENFHSNQNQVVRKNVFNYLCSKILVAMREWFLILGAPGIKKIKSNPL
jgi:hypothetical protein